jgi:hypothetical protein
MAADPYRDERDALYEEAKAIFDSAKAEFEAIQQTIRITLDRGRSITANDLLEEERLRARLFMARVRLSKREPYN